MLDKSKEKLNNFLNSIKNTKKEEVTKIVNKKHFKVALAFLVIELTGLVGLEVMDAFSTGEDVKSYFKAAKMQKQKFEYRGKVYDLQEYDVEKLEDMIIRNEKIKIKNLTKDKSDKILGYINDKEKNNISIDVLLNYNAQEDDIKKFEKIKDKVPDVKFYTHYSECDDVLNRHVKLEDYVESVNIINKMINSIKNIENYNKMEDIEKVYLINKKIAENTKYATTLLDSRGDNILNPSYEERLINTFVGINKGEFVCEGYAETFDIMANKLGLESYLLSGSVEEQSHSWNIVKVDNYYYQTDPTWVDNEKTRIYQDYSLNMDLEYLLSNIEINGNEELTKKIKKHFERDVYKISRTNEKGNLVDLTSEERIDLLKDVQKSEKINSNNIIDIVEKYNEEENLILDDSNDDISKYNGEVYMEM